MWNKDSLSRVTEYKPNGRTGATPAVRATGNETGEPPAPSKPDSPPSALDPNALKSALNNLSVHVQNLQRSLQFTVDQNSGDTVVKIVDAETHETIRQIPSEELLAIAERLRSAAGVFVAEKV